MSGGVGMSLGNRKLVVLGIPWDVDTEGLRSYMIKFGPLDDVIVMKDRSTGRSRGFGYVTFTNSEDAEKVAASEHSLNNRTLEVKVATPKEEMMKTSGKKVTRIFVARIPPSVTDEMFRRYFEKFGTITDAYMPKDQGSRAHRGIGFVTYESPESVEKLMSETHELAGSTIAVDRATPKVRSHQSADFGHYPDSPRRSPELEDLKFWGKSAYPTIYGPYGIYTSAAARLGAFGPSFGTSPFSPYDYTPSGLSNDIGNTGLGPYGVGGIWPPGGPPPGGMLGANGPPGPSRGLGNKIFVGRLPPEATAEDLRRHFSNFGRLLDVYVPKDSKRMSHRGFGFVTFADESVAERVALRSHEILGCQVAVDRATPQDEVGLNPSYGGSMGLPPGPGIGSSGGPIRGGGSLSGAGYGLGFDYNGGWPYGGMGHLQTGEGGHGMGHRSSRLESRYRPY